MKKDVAQVSQARLADSIASLKSRTVEETAERSTSRGFNSSEAARERAMLKYLGDNNSQISFYSNYIFYFSYTIFFSLSFL
jgi:hypothetical protein